MEEWEVASVLSSLELTQLFFKDLRSYNSTNFRTIEKAVLNEDDPTVHKAFSSVVTRYFIFAERHPEISNQDKRILYFKLKIDMIAAYFKDYPDSTLDLLRPFQLELQQYVRETKGGALDESTGTVAV
ncbi:MAG: hypothetical protein IJE78_04870 [Bacteroidaceae bacterium]|nr:hypothetical protein [Bacteroidaceae bacterium]